MFSFTVIFYSWIDSASSPSGRCDHMGSGERRRNRWGMFIHIAFSLSTGDDPLQIEMFLMRYWNKLTFVQRCTFNDGTCHMCFLTADLDFDLTIASVGVLREENRCIITWVRKLVHLKFRKLVLFRHRVQLLAANVETQRTLFLKCKQTDAANTVRESSITHYKSILWVLMCPSFMNTSNARLGPRWMVLGFIWR